LTAALLHGEALERSLAMQKRIRLGLVVVFICYCLSTTTTLSQNSTSPDFPQPRYRAPSRSDHPHDKVR
jgi:hypothetical protein